MTQNPFKENKFKVGDENPFADNPYKKRNIADEIKKDLGPTLPKTDEEINLSRIQSQKDNLETRLIASGVNPGVISESTAPVDDRNIIGRALNLNTDQGFLMDFFEVIDRPGQAIKGLLADGFEGAVAGLTGKTEITGEEFAKDVLGIDTSDYGKVGGFTANLAIDIFTDPLTYLPAGFFLKHFKKLGNIGSKMTKGTSQILLSQADNLARKKLDDLAKGIAKQGDVIDGQTFKTTVMDAYKARRARLESAYEVYQKTGDASGFGKGELGEFLIENAYLDELDQAFADVVDDIVKATGSRDNPFQLIAEGTQKVAGGGGKNVKDFSLYYRTVNEAGEEVFVRVGKFEAKTLLGNAGKTSQAFGNSLAMKFEDAMQSLVEKGYDKSILSELFGELKDAIGAESFDKFADTLFSGKFVEPGKLGVAIRKLMATDEQYQKFLKGARNLLFSQLEADNVTHVMLYAPSKVGGPGRPVMLSLDNAKKLFDGDNPILKMAGASLQFKPTSAFSKTDLNDVARGLIDLGYIADDTGVEQITEKSLKKLGQIKVKRTKQLDELYKATRAKKVVTLEDGSKLMADTTHRITQIKKLDDGYYVLKVSTANTSSVVFDTKIALAQGSKGFIDESLDEMGQFTASLFELTETAGEAKRISLLTRLAEGDSFVRRPAEIIKSALDNVEIMRYKLKFGRKLTPELRAQLSRINGEQAYRLNQMSRRAVKILNELSDQSPEGYKLALEILQTGAEIDAKGVISYVSKYTLGDTLQYAYDDLADGIATLLPKFADDAARTNYLTTLNNTVEVVTGEADLFKIVNRNGSEVLEFTGSITELEDILKQIKNSPAQSVTELTFGTTKLSSAAEDFFRQNGAQIDQLRGLQDDIFQIYIDELGFKNLDDAMKAKIGFKRHTLSRKAKKTLQELSPITRKARMREKTASLANRRFMGTSDEINRGLREFMDMDFNFFETDISKTLEGMIGASMASLGRARTLDAILQETDVDGDVLFKTIKDQKQALETMGPKYIALDEPFEKKFKNIVESLAPDELETLNKYFRRIGLEQGKTIAMHRSAVEALQRINNAFVEIPLYLKGLDKFLNFFKGVTLLNPGYHMRNFFGNMTNSYLVGMGVADQARYLARAGMDISQYNTLAQKVVDGVALSAKETETYTRLLRFFRSGAAQRHRATRDLDTLIKALEDAGQTGSQLRQSYRNLVKANFNLAEGMDDMQRYALFNWALESKRAKKVAKKLADEGQPQKLIDQAIEAEALNIVSESLFDYSALTSFEQHVMKRLFPFYTFFRKNLEFQMMNVLRNPQQYARIGRAYEEYNDTIAGIPTEDMPDYMQGNMWIPFPVSFENEDGEEVRTYLRANLPPSEVGEFLEGPLRRPVSMMNTFVKLPFELAVNRDAFTGAPLSEFKGQDNRLGEDNTGVLPTLRTDRGDFALSGNPVVQKIANDLGLRVPRNYTSLVLDIVDGITGARPGSDVGASIGTRLGVATTTPEYNREMTLLYQQLERLRQLQDLYEQQTQSKLPTLSELENMGVLGP